MKKTFLLSSLCIAVAFASQSAQADVKVRAGASSTSYKLSGDYRPSTSNYTPATVGATYITRDGLYIDLAYTGGTGTHDGYARAASPSFPSEEFQRSDISLIIGSGYNALGYPATVYAGLKSGTTKLGAAKPKAAGAVYGGTTVDWQWDTFTTTGIVFGGGVSFPIERGEFGIVGVNLGLGLMGTKWQDDSVSGIFMRNSASFGYSYGLSYTYPITSDFGVVADYKSNQYQYEFDATRRNVSESVTAAGLSVYTKF